MRNKVVKTIILNALGLGLVLGSSLFTNTSKKQPVETSAIGSYSRNQATYYTSDFNSKVTSSKYGTTLLNTLHELMYDSHKYFNTYAELRDYTKYTDYDIDNPDNIILLYSRQSINGTWNENVWNREHVWCQSHAFYSTETGAGSDLHHLRPASTNYNSTRSNTPYGIVANHNASTRMGDTDCYYIPGDTNGYFEPAEYIKGDVARILMYMYMHYSSSVSGTSTKSGTLNITDIVHTSANTSQAAWNLLMEWNESDPVDYQEMIRNNKCAYYLGNFNPFIDHPEFGRMIWDSSDNNKTGLFFTSSYKEVNVGSSYTNTAAKFGNVSSSGDIVYSSDNPSVATVSSSGQVTGVSNGVARIKARCTLNGVSKISYHFVKVGSGYTPKETIKATGIIYTPTSKTSAVASTTISSETVTYNNTFGISQLTSSNSLTLKVNNFPRTIKSFIIYMKSNQDGGAGTITAKVGGSTYNTKSGTFQNIYGSYSTSFVPIVLTNNNASVKTGTIELNISCSTNSLYFEKMVIDYTERTIISATGITVLPSSISLTPGEDNALVTSFTPTNTTLQTVTWSSSNPSIATVSKYGLVKAVALGSATITATAADGSNVTGTCSINVVEDVSGDDTTPTVNSVTVSPKSASLYLDGTKTQQLSVTVSVSNGAAQTVSWVSSNTTVATVSSSGLVTGKAAGSATITVSSTVDNTKYDQCTITVSASTPTLSSISVSTAPTKTTYTEGEYFNPTGLVITRTYSNSTSDTYGYSGHEGEFSFTPSLSTALTTSHTEVTITYNSKSCSQTITVNTSQQATYTLVTDDSTLVAGTTFIILHQSNAIAAGAYSNGIFPTVSATVSQNNATSEDATVFTLGGEAGSWTIKYGNNYIGKTGSSGTGIDSNASVSTGYHWTISIADGKVTMKTESSGTRAFAYNYNNGSDRFGAYTPSNTYTLPRMFAIIPSGAQSVLSSVTSSGQTTSFAEGTSFSYGGTLTANYTQGAPSATVTPTSFKIGVSGINPTSAGTTITTNTTMNRSTHNGKYVYVVYTENGITKWDSYQITVTVDPSLTWTAPTINVYSGTTLTVEDANSWNVTYDDGNGSQTILTYSQFSVKLGGLAIALPYTWQPNDDGKSLCVSYNLLTSSTSTVSIVQTIQRVDGEVPGEASTKTWNATAAANLGAKITEVNGVDSGSLTFNDASTMTYTRTLEYLASNKEDYISYTSPYIQFGSSNALETLELSISNSNVVTQVQIYCWAKNGATDVTVTVGGSVFDEIKSAPTAAGSLTFTGSKSGNIVITMEKSSKTSGCAQYIASVSITTQGQSTTENIANVEGHEDAQRAVVKFAKAFNTAMGTTNYCTTYMSTAWSSATSAWNTFLSEAAALGETEEAYAKNLIKYATAQYTDGTDSDYSYCLERAMATYEKCVKSHGQTAFMSAVRPVSANTNINPILVFGDKASSGIAVIIIVSVISVTAIGGYFFMKSKRKEEF